MHAAHTHTHLRTWWLEFSNIHGDASRCDFFTSIIFYYFWSFFSPNATTVFGFLGTKCFQNLDQLNTYTIYSPSLLHLRMAPYFMIVLQRMFRPDQLHTIHPIYETNFELKFSLFIDRKFYSSLCSGMFLLFVRLMYSRSHSLNGKDYYALFSFHRYLLKSTCILFAR